MVHKLFRAFQCFVLVFLLFQPLNVNAQNGSSYQVKDINPGPADSNPVSFMPYKSLTLFFAKNSAGISELWVTGGASENTRLLKTGVGSPHGDLHQPSIVYKDILYFPAMDNAHGQELWRSDGTPEGTYLFYDFNDPLSQPDNFVIYNDLLYFSYDTFYGNIATTDGTVTQTYRGFFVTDIAPFNGNLYALAYYNITDLGAHMQLIQVASGDPSPSASPIYYTSNRMAVYKGNLYYSLPQSTDEDLELYRMDQDGNKSLFKDINLTTPGGSDPSGFYIYQDMLYFSADDHVNGREIWRTDGTAEGTQLFADLTQGSDSTYPEIFGTVFTSTDHTSRLIFSSGTNLLWSTDGTENGTIHIADLLDFDHRTLVPFNNEIYFTGADHNLWRTDGTVENTQPIAPIGTYSNFAAKDTISPCGSVLCYSAYDAEYGWELWAYTPGDSYAYSIYLPIALQR